MVKTIVAVAALLAVLGVAAWHLSPWPSALLYRYLFDRGGVAMNAALADHVPAGVAGRADTRYGTDPAETLDLYRPAGVEATGRALPMIFWIHGGGFLSGDKSQIANYLRIVAAAGYAVVGINYTLTPRARHPAPTRQAHAALAFVAANAAAMNVDTGRVILAGDSAGAHIAAQLGITLTDPAYARSIGIEPALPRDAIRGLVLYCGIYDPDLLKGAGAMAGFLSTVSWAYLGTKEVGGPATPQPFSIIRNLPASMPPLFITAGNADLLLSHSRALAAAARRLDVTVDALLFAENHEPPLQHEYQFDLGTAAGHEALQRSLAFISERTR